MPWLAAHNPEINWEKEEVKMMCCLPIYRKRKQKEKKKVVRKTKEEKTVEELVPRRFWKWKRVFGKAELKKGFMSKKGKVYSLSREE